jgi:putative phosphoribosyl transferase
VYNDIICRIDATEQLAKRVKEWLNKNMSIEMQKQEQQQKPNNDDIIVLAIPRGGVLIDDVISNILHAKLDIIVSRKIGAPNNPELAIDALSSKVNKVWLQTSRF